jgi:hypothetical protein
MRLSALPAKAKGLRVEEEEETSQPINNPDFRLKLLTGYAQDISFIYPVIKMLFLSNSRPCQKKNLIGWTLKVI